jgi:hypothetical protein
VLRLSTWAGKRRQQYMAGASAGTGKNAWVFQRFRVSQSRFAAEKVSSSFGFLSEFPTQPNREFFSSNRELIRCIREFSPDNSETALRSNPTGYTCGASEVTEARKLCLMLGQLRPKGSRVRNSEILLFHIFLASRAKICPRGWSAAFTFLDRP